MSHRILTGALAGIICVLFILCAGCTTVQDGAPVPGTQTPAATETPAVAATPIITPTIRPDLTPVGMPAPRDTALDQYSPSVRDAAFNALLVKSLDEIANKTDLVIFQMSQSETMTKLGYSPARLFLAADDLGYTTEMYYDQVLKTEAYTMENENKRVEYVQFLYSAKNAANHITDAAEAEALGDYQGALLMAMAAKADLAGIEYGPDLPISSRFNRLNVYLSEFIGRMQDNIVQQKTLETAAGYKRSGMSSSDMFPRLPR